MKTSYVCMILTGWWGLAMSATADVIWSGEMDQRTYHDIAAIDFNLDGTDDFTFQQEAYDSYRYYYITPTIGRVVADDQYGLPIGYPLADGEVIFTTPGDPDLVWTNTETFLFSYGEPMTGETSHGGFFVQNKGYLGISFNVSGSTHYGWIEMSHDVERPSPNDQYLYIEGWAWETEANTAILAGVIPEPSSGILTMIGTLSLLQLARSRRRRKQGFASPPRYRVSKISTTPKEW